MVFLEMFVTVQEINMAVHVSLQRLNPVHAGTNENKS